MLNKKNPPKSFDLGGLFCDYREAKIKSHTINL
jgi:hypothetical protein